MTVDEQAIPASMPIDSRSRRLARAVCSFPAVLIALLVVLTVLTVRSRFNDPDMWWHLKTGEIIWNTHSIPRVDLFSFTTNQHAYTPHEWLSQLGIYAVYHFAGYTGLMFAFCTLASLIAVAGYALCRIYGGNSKVAFLGAMGIWFFATVGFSLRPQLPGYLMLIFELLVIALGRTRNAKWFLALPPMFLVWVNLHGSFFFGLIVLSILLFCASIELRFGLLVSHRWTWEQRKVLAVAFGLSILALFLNPIGIEQLTYPLNTMFSQQIGLQYSSEWQPPPMSDFRVWALFGTAAMILILPLLTRCELSLDELLLMGLGFGLGVQHERMLFVFGILVMPALCRLLATAWDEHERRRNRTGLNLILIVAAMVTIAINFPTSRDLAEQVRKANPVRAMDFIRRSGLSGRMLNEYVYGGYLIWTAPERRVFIDGRADVYEWSGVFADYMDWVNLKKDPRELLEKYHIDYCLLSRAEPMVHVLPLVPGWKTIYSDDMSVVLARASAGGSSEGKNHEDGR
jgi:hypothetical protein